MTGADPMLDQSNWPPAWTRAHALAAARTWLPVTDGEEALLEAAERFAAWIEADNERRGAGCDWQSIALVLARFSHRTDAADELSADQRQRVRDALGEAYW